MAILVTGASGFLGSALVPRLLAKGHKVYGLSRHPPEPVDNLIPLAGDITEPGLGLKEMYTPVPDDIEAVHHLAAEHRLGQDTNGLIWRTNVGGTKNVADFCLRHNIPHLFFCSTAYTQGRNDYERSKAVCEVLVKDSGIRRWTIFKPSIIMGTPQHFYPGHFSQFISLLAKVHQRGEHIRRKVEGTLKLPPIEPRFRVKGNPKGRLNLIQIDAVAEAMANIRDQGTFWLTHPDPPGLADIAEWISAVIMVRLSFKPEFKPKPIEAIFQKWAAPFLPYSEGDQFPSDIKNCPPITKEFIEETILRTLFD